ncbi:MAG TPA: DUF4118 domain-containing protein, partial [Candidatus Limnocylindrales bacterium]|nr:DUF4118 domain-containing protein [Candidatus Limnocylindrales bacterium]
MPAGLAMFTVGLIMLLFGRVSGIFSLVAVIFLTAVMYAALHAGVRQGLISAALVVTFNGLTLFPLVERYSLTDPNLRRIVLLAVILPTLAYVVGRLHDRNQYLLEHEREARRKAEESERRLRFMAESMPQKIFTNTPDGKPLYSNPQW